MDPLERAVDAAHHLANCRFKRRLGAPEKRRRVGCDLDPYVHGVGLHASTSDANGLSASMRRVRSGSSPSASTTSSRTASVWSTFSMSTSMRGMLPSILGCALEVPRQFVI